MNSGDFNLPIAIDRLNRSEVNVAINWAKKEGWNPGLHDAECFYRADPKGFYAAKLGGEIVATISLVRYSDGLVFEGLYIVKPQLRGVGIGRHIQEFALDITKDVNLGLDGVVSMRQKYEQYGFKFAYSNQRYSGTANSAASKDCLPVRKKDFAEVAALDRECFLADRTNFLKCWLYQKDATSRLIRDKKGQISGYGVIRRCEVGHKIGPLFADNATTAEDLFNSLTATVNGETVFFDVPQPNIEAEKLAKLKGMKPVFSTLRMYTKETPKLPLNRIFGVTSFELG